MNIEELRQSLLQAPKNGYAELTDAQRAEMETRTWGSVDPAPGSR